MRLEQQIVGDVADRGRRPSAVPLYDDKQLVLDVRQARGLRLVLAPALEPAQRDAELEQLVEVILTDQRDVTLQANYE